MRKKFWIFFFIFIMYFLIPGILTLIINGNRKVDISGEYVSGKKVIINGKNVNKSVSVNEYIVMVIAEIYKEEDEIETVKALSVLIRSDINRKMGDSESIESNNLDYKYCNYDDMKERWEDKYEDNYNMIVDCVSSTQNQVITYNGNIIEAFYCEVSNGKTLSGGKYLGEEYKYLKEVACEQDVNSEYYIGNVMLNKSQFLKLLEKIQKSNKYENVFDDTGLDKNDPCKDVQIVEKTSEGVVTKVQLGDKIIDGNIFSEAFGINSPCMMMEYSKEKDTTELKIVSKGKGLGFGMSIYTANYMAKNGSDYNAILNEFFADVQIVEE